MLTIRMYGAVALLTALPLFSTMAMAQDWPENQLLRTRYLSLLKLMGDREYERAFDESQKLIDEAPRFGRAYGKLVEAAGATNRLEQAKTYLERLLTSAPPNPMASYGLALVHWRRNEPAAAAAAARHCLEAAPEFAPAYEVLLDSYWMMNQPAEAESYLKSVTQKKGELSAPYYGLGYLCYLRREWQEGIPVLNKAIDLAPAATDARQMKAIFYYYTHDYRGALEITEALAEAAKARSDPEYLLNAAMNTGIYHRILGDYAQAATRLKEALATAEEYGDRVTQDTCLSNLSDVYMRQDDYSQALDYGRRWLAMARALYNQQNEGQALDSKRSEGRALGFIGAVYRELGDLAQALTYYQQSLSLAREINDRENTASMLSDLGTVYIELKAYNQALTAFQEALQIIRQTKNRSLEIDALAGQAYLYFAINNYPAALVTQAQAVQLARDISTPSRQGTSLNALGFMQLRLSDLQAASRSFQDGLAIGARIQAPSIVWQARVGLAAICERQGAIDQAREHYQKAIEALERVRGRLGAEDERVGFFQNKVKFYKDLVATLMRLHVKDATKHYDAEAFRFSERGRARAFLDLLGEAKNVDQAIDPDLLKRQEAIQAAISKLNTQLIDERSKQLDKQDMTKVKKLEEDLGKADLEQADWLRELRRRNRRYADLKYPEPLNLEEARRALDNQSLILAYSLGEQASFLFAVSHNGHLAAPLKASAGEIRDGVEKMIAAITDRNNPSPDEYRRQAARLYQLLIRPAAKMLAGKRELIIIADDALQRLPFEALLGSPSAKGAAITSSDPRRWPYLVGQFAVSYAPSVSAWASLKDYHKETGAPQKAFVAYADPNYNRQGQRQNDSIIASVTRSAGGERLELNQLRYSRYEVEEIARLFGEGETKLYLDDEASEENVKAEDRLSLYRIVHFSAHGLISETRPRFSGIVLALPKAGNDGKTAQEEDGLLSAYEIFNLKLNAELVTLSACETGLGKEVGGEGIMGLMRAFIYAGTPSVVVSLWRVDDESAADLMIGFYKYWQGGGKGKLSKAEALRRARLDAIKQGSLPYYWAPFILVGRS
jgi:CHAT domain-containing protein/Flp pilus assembly protein TadD